MDINKLIKLNPKIFWATLELHHQHINRNYVMNIMQSLNEMGLLTAEGRKVLENLIIEDGKVFKIELNDDTRNKKIS